MQLGEGLHLANFVAANLGTSLVYDREMLEQFAGTDLPWSTSDAVARMGVEYRNNLLGHVHALGPSVPPTRYYAGHERSDRPEDWPPNKVACEEMRGLGATVGYPHPAFTAFPEDWSTSRFFQTPRSVEARELVADAALGVVDSIDLISPFDDEGAGRRSRRPSAEGVRGHQRTVAHFRCERARIWRRAELGRRRPPRHPGPRQGHGAEQLTLVGPDGVVAEGDAASDLRIETTLADGPTWIAAVAHGRGARRRSSQHT